MNQLRKANPIAGASGGFTLVEMLVSITLVAMIALCVWGALRITISSWKRGTESIDVNQQRRATLDLMEKQIASMSAVLPPIDPQTGLGQYPIFVGADNAMEFLSPCAFRFQDNPGMAFVEYDVVTDADGGVSLIEKETTYLGGDPTQGEGIAESDETTIPIFEHLAGVSLEYFDPGTQDVAPQWVTEWSGADYMSLPAAIKITISARDTAGGAKDRQIVIPVQSKINTTQIGGISPLGNVRRAPNVNTGR